jgi:putative acetyltransferase
MNINIRQAAIEDCDELYNIRQMPKVMENILSYKDEPKDGIRNRFLNKGNDLWIVSEAENKVVGLIILSMHNNPRKKHVGYITIMVNSDYHGMGIGSKLMTTITDIADNKLRLKRLELSVFIENERAIKLYKKFGFNIEGVAKMSALRNGIYSDEYHMARMLTN